MLLVSRCDAKHSYKSFFTADVEARSFVEEGLRKGFREFCTLFEAHVLRASGSRSNESERRNLMKSQIRSLVKVGLRMFVSLLSTRNVVDGLSESITGDPALQMSWLHYETDIVRKKQVMLHNWPLQHMNLDSASQADLSDILDNLETGTCRWMKLTEEQLADKFGEKGDESSAPPKKRAKRSDAGKKRGPYKNRRKAAAASTEDVIASDN